MFPRMWVKDRGYPHSAVAILLLVLFGLFLQGCSNASRKQGLSVGDEAPPFTLPSATGGAVSLTDYVGEKPVLLYFHMADG